MSSRARGWHFVLALLLLTALTLVPQAIFAADDTAQKHAAQTQQQVAAATKNVDGWSPAEIQIVKDDPEVDNATDLPTFKESSIYSDPDSVFTRGFSTVGYDALTTDAERNYYKALEKEALAFMNAKEDLKPTEMETSAGVKDVYVIAQLKFEDYGIENYEEASHAYYAFDYDHPAYYWISNSVLSSGAFFYLTTYEEYASVDERARINSLVDSGVKEFIAKAEYGADTLDKIAMIHDQIVSAVDYAYEDDGKTTIKDKWAHSVQGVFDKDLGKVVCEGYADAFALIMNYMGIPNYYIVGSEGAKGGGHAWNAVSADGGKTYLYVDLTWDDLGKKGYTYEYFGMPASDFEDLHYKYLPNYKRNRWLYPITGKFNDELSGTYYKQGGFYCDSTGSKTDDILLKGRTKAGRVGSHVSFLVPSRKLLVCAAVAGSLGISGNSFRTVSYKGTNYSIISAPVSDRKINLSAASLTLGKTEYLYNDGPIEPRPVVTCNGVTLIDGSDYTLSYGNNIEIGENASITATGTGNFTGSASTKFTIYPHDHVWADPEFNWNTDLSTVTATRTCTLEKCNVKAETETADTSSEVTREPSCTEEGTRTYKATFQNPAFGTQTKDVPIKALGHTMTEHPAVAAICTEAGNSAYWYCDACRKYFADKDGGNEIDEGSWVIDALGHEWDEGMVTTEPTYVSAGIRTFTCIHDPAHTMTEEIPIKTLKGTKITKLVKGKKQMTVKWKKQKQATGYQIRYSLKKNFKSGVKTLTVKKSKTTSKIIKKLKSKKKYYVRIRTYKKIGDQRCYSAWSKTKSVKTK